MIVVLSRTPRQRRPCPSPDWGGRRRFDVRPISEAFPEPGSARWATSSLWAINRPSARRYRWSPKSSHRLQAQHHRRRRSIITRARSYDRRRLYMRRTRRRCWPRAGAPPHSPASRAPGSEMGSPLDRNRAQAPGSHPPLAGTAITELVSHAPRMGHRGAAARLAVISASETNRSAWLGTRAWSPTTPTPGSWPVGTATHRTCSRLSARPAAATSPSWRAGRGAGLRPRGAARDQARPPPGDRCREGLRHRRPGRPDAVRCRVGRHRAGIHPPDRDGPPRRRPGGEGGRGPPHPAPAPAPVGRAGGVRGRSGWAGRLGGPQGRPRPPAGSLADGRSGRTGSG